MVYNNGELNISLTVQGGTYQMEKLIQIRVEEEVRNAADAVFKENGLTTQQAVKMFLTQVAHSGESPFNDLFRAKHK